MAKFKLNAKKNFKAAITKKEMTENAKGLIAIPIYLGIASLLKLNGYVAYFVSFGLTWLTGAVFGIPAICRASWGIAGMHWVYVEGTGFIQNTLGIPLWRFGTYQFETLPASTAGVSGIYMNEGQFGNFSRTGVLTTPESPVMTNNLNGYSKAAEVTSIFKGATVSNQDEELALERAAS